MGKVIAGVALLAVIGLFFLLGGTREPERVLPGPTASSPPRSQPARLQPAPPPVERAQQPAGSTGPASLKVHVRAGNAVATVTLHWLRSAGAAEEAFGDPVIGEREWSGAKDAVSFEVAAELLPCDVSVVVRPADTESFAPVASEVIRLAPGAAREITLRLFAPGSVQGTLLLSDGAEPGEVLRLQAVPLADVGTDPESLPLALCGYAEPDGRFVVSGIPRGIYRLFLMSDGWMLRDPVTVESGDAGLRLVVARVMFLRVRAKDVETGEGLPGFSVRFRWFVHESGEEEIYRGRGERGRVVLTCAQPGWYEPSRVGSPSTFGGEITVVAEGYRPVTTSVAIQGRSLFNEAMVELIPDRGPNVGVVVRYEDGRPHLDGLRGLVRLHTGSAYVPLPMEHVGQGRYRAFAPRGRGSIEFMPEPSFGLPHVSRAFELSEGQEWRGDLVVEEGGTVVLSLPWMGDEDWWFLRMVGPTYKDRQRPSAMQDRFYYPGQRVRGKTVTLLHMLPGEWELWPIHLRPGDIRPYSNLKVTVRRGVVTRVTAPSR